jgi:hypothetical protein
MLFSFCLEGECIVIEKIVRFSVMICLAIASCAPSAWAVSPATQRDRHGVTLTTGSIATRVEIWRDSLVRVTHRPASIADAIRA